MSSIDHLHTEAEMLKVKEHSELLSAQYLAADLLHKSDGGRVGLANEEML